MRLNENKLYGLISRVYNNKMEENDHRDIVEYTKRVFGDGSFNPDPSMLHQFNNLVVKKADEVAKPMMTDILSIFATFESARRDEIVRYEIPQQTRTKFRWSANGSGVDLVRVEGKRYETAVPKPFSIGFYYEPFGMIRDAAEGIRNLINDIANAKVRLYIDEVYKLVDSAILSGKIPAANVLAGDNLNLKQYNKIASILSRYGGRPIFVADSLLIDHFAMQQATDTTFKELLTDPLRSELAHSLNPTTIGRTTAVNLVNPFIDDQNTKVEYPVNVGYMLAGTQKQKPFVIVEFGGMRQLGEQDIEDERIKIKLVQDADIVLIFGQTLARIVENTAVAL